MLAGMNITETKESTMKDITVRVIKYCIRMNRLICFIEGGVVGVSPSEKGHWSTSSSCLRSSFLA